MNYKEVTIFNKEGRDDWESNLIRGALWYFGVPSRVCHDKDSGEVSNDTLCVVLSAYYEKKAPFDNPQLFRGTIVIAGRNVTIEYLQGRLRPADNEILIYGEPYTLIRQLAMDQGLVKQLRGKSVLGVLLDPREYCTPPILKAQEGWAYIMTSMGCQKRCGYCSYGTIYSGLYPKDFTRRSRPWKDIEKNIIDLMGEGINSFKLLSDQFLSRNPEENKELYSLAQNWNSYKTGKPIIAFTVSPLEVLNNKITLESMSHSFYLHPRLSIDSFDNNTLDLLDLDFDASTALEALKFLAYLKLPLRINYIFIRPGMTINSIREEFFYFKLVAVVTSYLNFYEKILLIDDFLSNSLGLIQGAPISHKNGIKERYKEGLPPELLKKITKLLNVIQGEIDNLHIKDGSDPLLTVAEAGLNELVNVD